MLYLYANTVIYKCTGISIYYYTNILRYALIDCWVNIRVD